MRGLVLGGVDLSASDVSAGLGADRNALAAEGQMAAQNLEDVLEGEGRELTPGEQTGPHLSRSLSLIMSAKQNYSAQILQFLHLKCKVLKNLGRNSTLKY